MLKNILWPGELYPDHQYYHHTDYYKTWKNDGIIIFRNECTLTCRRRSKQDWRMKTKLWTEKQKRTRFAYLAMFSIRRLEFTSQHRDNAEHRLWNAKLIYSINLARLKCSSPNKLMHPMTFRHIMRWSIHPIAETKLQLHYFEESERTKRSSFGLEIRQLN